MKHFAFGRHCFLILLGFLGLGALVWRLMMLQVLEKEYLQEQGQARSVRKLPLVTHRGMIFDRHGEPLAISATVKSVWVNPKAVSLSDPNWQKLAYLLEIPFSDIESKILQKSEKQFLYLKRHLSPLLGKKIQALQLAGVSLQTEYRRFYPAGEVVAHVIGTTDIDHRGIQGLELSYDRALGGENGQYRVLKDARGQGVEGYEVLKPPVRGKDITLSIDSRIQYLAYRELYQTVKKSGARGGSIVVLDVKTGEVLAMVNQPSYNPNVTHTLIDERFRNRAVTDLLEPGSVMKPFSVVSLLKSGKYHPYSEVDTNPGWIKISGRKEVLRDRRNYGVLNLTRLMQKSSNVGIAKLTLSLPPSTLYHTLQTVGIGESTESGFPGERKGYLAPEVMKSPAALVTASFGYSLAVTPLQLARAYAILAEDGCKRPITFVKGEKPLSCAQQVLDPAVTAAVNKMLQLSVAPDSTGYRAYVPRYNAAGKTGTVRKIGPQGYVTDRHLSVFAGFAPAEAPKVVVVVVVDEPKGDYYGGQVAAPLFSRVMFGTLTALNVPSYQLPTYVLARKENEPSEPITR